jgi:hypothetical protein
MEAEGARKVQMDAMSSLYDQLLRGDLPRAASD